MSSHYLDKSRGLNFKIIGFISEDDVYELYLAQSKHPTRNAIIHVLKNGERRYNVKTVKNIEIVIQKPSATREEVVLPWKGDGLGGDFFEKERVRVGRE